LIDINMPLMDGATLVGNHRNPAASTDARLGSGRRPRELFDAAIGGASHDELIEMVVLLFAEAARRADV